MAWRLLLHSWWRREPRESLSLHWPARFIHIKLASGCESAYTPCFGESVGGERPSFVLLSPSVHAATVNRYTAACMESKEDEEAWRSASEREREKSAQLTHFLGADESRCSPTRVCIINNQQLHHNAHNAHISPWLVGCFLALSPAPRCAHAFLVCLKLAHWQFCLIVWVCCARALSLARRLDHANGTTDLNT
jgi:hypothetical protein